VNISILRNLGRCRLHFSIL